MYCTRQCILGSYIHGIFMGKFVLLKYAEVFYPTHLTEQPKKIIHKVAL